MSQIASQFQSDFQTAEENKTDESPILAGQAEIILPYSIRAQFRPKLQEFFEMTNKGMGSYIWAEQKAKEFFLATMGIPFIAWNYRK